MYGLAIVKDVLAISACQMYWLLLAGVLLAKSTLRIAGLAVVSCKVLCFIVTVSLLARRYCPHSWQPFPFVPRSCEAAALVNVGMLWSRSNTAVVMQVAL